MKLVSCGLRRLPPSRSLLPARSRRLQMHSQFALGRPIIDGSSSWNGSPHKAAFSHRRWWSTVEGRNRIMDRSTTGWAARTLCRSILRLTCKVRNIDEIRLFNTHNRQSNDRGTENFRLWGSLAVDGSTNSLLRSC